MKVALYARVSTDDKGQDPEVQLRDLRARAQLEGWEVAGEFVDVISGTKDVRPAMTELMKAARRRRFQMVCVWAIDRWGRSMIHMVRSLDELNKLGVKFYSAKESIDTSTPAGELLYNVLSSFATFERRRIVERITAGLRLAKAKGKHLGRPRKMLNVGRIRALKAEGLSVRAIAEKVGSNRTSVAQALL